MLPPYTAHRINAACFDAMDVGSLVQSDIVLPRSRGQFCPSWPHSLLAHRILHYSQWGLRNKTSTSVAPSRVALVSPPLPPPSPQPAPCLPVTMRATRADCGPPRAPSRKPREKKGNARGPANRDGEDATRTSTAITTPTQVNPKAHRPTASTRRSTRRRKNPYRARGHQDAKYPQPRGSVTS